MGTVGPSHHHVACTAARCALFSVFWHVRQELLGRGVHRQIYRSTHFSEVAISSQVFGYVAVMIFSPNPNWSLLNVWIVAKVILLVLLTDIGFSWSHSLLHTVPSLTKAHRLHHLCFNPTWISGTMFEAPDLALEFSWPVGILVVLNRFTTFFSGEELFALSFLVLQMWYAATHDESIRLPHFWHHTRISSVYSIYTPLSGDPKKNILRREMAKYINHGK